jgi:hypothetical protein
MWSIALTVSSFRWLVVIDLIQNRAAPGWMDTQYAVTKLRSCSIVQNILFVNYFVWFWFINSFGVGEKGILFSLSDTLSHDR